MRLQEGPRRKAFIRNALVYGAPALLYLLASPFQGVSLMGFMRGEAWWLSLVFGLVHLQLERKDMVDEARARVAETRLPEPKPEDELERASRELQEFDQQLSTVAWSRGGHPIVDSFVQQSSIEVEEVDWEVAFWFPLSLAT